METACERVSAGEAMPAPVSPHPSPPPSKGEGKSIEGARESPPPLWGRVRVGGGHALNVCLDSGLRNLNRTAVHLLRGSMVGLGALLENGSRIAHALLACPG